MGIAGGAGIPESVVNAAKDSVKKEIDALPNGEKLKACYDNLIETMSFLKTCWETTGGNKELKKLFSIVEELETIDYNKFISNVKNSYNDVKINQVDNSRRLS